MSVLYILILASIFVACVFLGGFIWAVKTGQYDDAHTPAMRILFDDNPADSNELKTGQSSKLKKNKEGTDV